MAFVLFMLPGALARAEAAGYIEHAPDGTMWSKVPDLPRTRVVLLKFPACA